MAEEAKDLLEFGSRKGLASTLEDLTNTFTKRQKVIRLADKFSGGWNTVDEYLQDELASDSDGNKKMRQAEARAMAKIRPEKASAKLRFWTAFSSKFSSPSITTTLSNPANSSCDTSALDSTKSVTTCSATVYTASTTIGREVSYSVECLFCMWKTRSLETQLSL